MSIFICKRLRESRLPLAAGTSSRNLVFAHLYFRVNAFIQIIYNGQRDTSLPLWCRPMYYSPNEALYCSFCIISLGVRVSATPKATMHLPSSPFCTDSRPRRFSATLGFLGRWQQQEITLHTIRRHEVNRAWGHLKLWLNFGLNHKFYSNFAHDLRARISDCFLKHSNQAAIRFPIKTPKTLR